jgi:hypothetical protein
MTPPRSRSRPSRRSSLLRIGESPGNAPVVCLGGALGGVSVTIDQLQIGQTPIVEQRRPRRISPLAPHPEQRHAMVDLGRLPQSPARLGAAPGLEAAQKSHFVARRIPELPGDHARAMPVGVFVWTAIPQIDVPAEAINRLPAHAAKSRAARKGAFAVRCRRRAERGGQSTLAAIAKPPRPACRCSTASSERPRQTIGAQRMGAPIGIDGQPRRRRHERPPQGA